ncbi:ribonucleoside-diphosphate reductase subunit alpha [Fictibacillus nanhaiensis]|uniref:ribonucleoside-diphosphate reductase subunit alpha n=1 Tax=Fictibacillus nanhaiensis TaxID=742169 RepID=UPI002E1DC81B|nr:ribonucleoside-diphosphate reductase subunit alpha [Fictibacillus nanhaiensis]MED1863381.1 ribonucleoside-diphosphate reductase subunit alpha [Fictibacillus nanhaiensis]
MTVITKDRKSHISRTQFDRERFDRFIDEIIQDSHREYNQSDIEDLKVKVVDSVLTKKEIEAVKLFDLIIRESNDLISPKSPEYTYLSASALRRKIYKQASKNRGFDYHKGYGDYYSLIIQLTEQGLYSDQILKAYTEQEIRKAGKFIDMEKDKLFSYAGLYMMQNTYLVKGYNGEFLELPQERFLSTALYLMKDEKKSKRLDLVKESYWALSNHYIGLATPSLKNSATPHGTLSSCHIVTMGDDLDSIMNSLHQVAKFSQNGAGLGIYLGFLRGSGSWIRGFKGRATGITHPSRLLSVLAEYVNQLGARKAGIAAYLPVWHLDIFDFLDLRLKTGSQEKRAHSIKTAVCLPDEFMRRLQSKKTWTIVDPYEVKKKLGLDINKLYDKKKLQSGEEPNEEYHAFTYFYRNVIETADLELKRVIAATEIYKAIFTARKTSGTPYLYYSDTVARTNPNSHAGMPYGSNLCSEICQNMSYDVLEDDELLEDGFVVTRSLGEGLVTCNLNSLVLHNVFGDENVDLQRVVDIQFRMLDNVISLNRTVVKQATQTNNLYRAVGAGALGLVTLMTEKGIKWDSPESAKFTDELFEKYAKAAIRASHKLGMEKGSYPKFEGSEWNTGDYFDKRGYDSPEWQELKELAKKSMRNGYLMAIAPTSSNSIIMNGSPSIDPLYEVVYREEKSGLNVIIVPSNYNNKTKWYYQSGFQMDEMWAINVISAAQKHIDQAISHNMHVLKSIKGSEMLRLDIGAWEKNLKTIYYTYTEDYERDESCINCEA